MKQLTQEQFTTIYTQVPRVAVELVIKDGDEVLLTKRTIPSYKGYWHLPGGTVFMQEPLDQAVKRIAKQELNLKVKILGQVGVNEFLNEDQTRHTVCIVFLCSLIGGQLVLDKNASQAGWFKKAPSKTIPEHKQYTKHYTNHYV